MFNTPFYASVLLMLLPVLIGVVRRPFDNRVNRAATALVLGISMLAHAMAWSYDYIMNDIINIGIGASVCILPITILLVLIRGFPFIRLKHDLSSFITARFEYYGWLSSLFSSIILVFSMYSIDFRLHPII